VLVPGIFGFDSFGPPAAPRIEYFAGVVGELMHATGWPRDRFVVHVPSPTGPLAARVASLHQRVEEVLSRPGVERVHLVGHSTGGLDARLLVNPRYSWPGAPDLRERRERVARAVASVITVAAPFGGSPLARRLRGGLGAVVPALNLLSILLMDRGLGLRTQLALVGPALRQLLPGRHGERNVNRLGELALALIERRDQETAEQVVRFLRAIVRDQRLHGDLTPEAMADLNQAIAGADSDSIASFVTVSPPPPRKLVGRHPAARLFYAIAYRLATPEGDARRRFPDGPWLLDSRARDDLRTKTAGDGVVPSASQVLAGRRAAAIVLADHLDVIGHYEGSHVGATYLKSGADFTNASFSALWRAVGLRLGDAEARRTSVAA